MKKNLYLYLSLFWFFYYVWLYFLFTPYSEAISSGQSLADSAMENLLDQYMKGLTIALIFSILTIALFVINVINMIKTARKKFKSPQITLEGLKRGEAVFQNIKPTGNKEPVYQITMMLKSDEKELILEKEVRVAAYLIHYLKLNEVYPVAYNPEKKSVFYMNYAEGDFWI